MTTPQDDREARIRERAYFLWLEEGCPNGREDEHWLLAAAAEEAAAERASDTEALLDAALDATFPASDPPAMIEPAPEPAPEVEPAKPTLKRARKAPSA